MQNLKGSLRSRSVFGQLVLVSSLVAGVTAACYTGPTVISDTDAKGDATTPTVLACGSTAEALRTSVFARDCSSSACHGGSDPAGSLDLALPGWETKVIGAAASECGGQVLVVPGDPEGSYLFRKLVDAKPACGSRMPKGSTPDDAQVACVRAWIVALGGTKPPPGSDDGGTVLADGAVVPADAAPACENGKTPCNGTCVALATDPKNCGTCGKTCPVACAASACVTACTGTTTNCSGACVDTTSDSTHCGSCTNVCGVGKTCVGSECACGATVSFAAQIQPILTRECTSAGCHVGAQPKSSLLLTAGASYGALVNAASSTCTAKVRVVPGQVDKSYLVNKLTGIGMCAGTQMPKTGGALPANEIDLVRAWICNGAPNN